MTELRTKVLNFYDGKWLWRSDVDGTLLRRFVDGRYGWWVYADGMWERCVDSEGETCYYLVLAHPGETFIRVGEIL